MESAEPLIGITDELFFQVFNTIVIFLIVVAFLMFSVKFLLKK